ncbi:MAG: ABC transporter substrate-binding protein [Solirubrobacterales bacterium]|nr:ABC transporter substrate-binding protein [Solirubrobacterales bacterium]MBV9715941.1 ABC transporter substrate-binding protein [Solirubrobacterales bacterium]
MRGTKASAAWLGAVLTAVVLAACGSSSSKTTSASGGAGTTSGGGSSGQSASKKPIVIGAAIDQSSTMKPFDSPAAAAAQLEVNKINAQGGVDGRKLEFIVENDQLNPSRTRADALDVVGKGANVLWVTCDVDFATPSTEVGLSKSLLTVAPCIGTDQMGPKRFGSQGKLAFSYGNVAQDEGAALAQLAIKQGWKTADVVTDKSIVYEVNDCQAFTKRFTELGGKVVAQDQFTQGDHTVGSVASKVNGQKAAVVTLCTYPTPAGDLPAFVSDLRSLGNQTPILGPWSIDGTFWLPKDPKVSNNIWYVTYASVFGDDPDPAVKALEQQLTSSGNPPATGGFVTGAAAIDGIVAAIKQSGGSTDGSKLAAAMESFHNLPTVSGAVSFSPSLHSVYGRQYRVMHVVNGKPKYIEEMKATTPASIG